MACWIVSASVTLSNVRRTILGMLVVCCDEMFGWLVGGDWQVG